MPSSISIWEFPLSSALFLVVTTCSAKLHFDVLNGANFPDSSIITVGGVTYAFATNDGAGHNIPVTSNPKFNNPNGWSEITDAFPVDGVPAFGDDGWAVEGTTWAPDVNHLKDYDGSFAMYYSPALQDNDGIHCLGLARSANVEGPYNDSSTAPLICPEEAGGAIDAAGFLDSDSKRYVVYKIDGPAINNGGYCASPDNPPSTNTSLMLQQVENDGYTTIGGPAVLFNNEGESDSYNVEAPILVKSEEGVYFLFFSSGCYNADSYTVSYVSSKTSVWGPYGKRTTLLKTGDYGLYAPGGADVLVKSGKMAIHSFTESNSIDDGRVMDTARISFQGRKVLIK
jgi:hypothetical protein